MYIGNQLYKSNILKIITPVFENMKNKNIFITGSSGLVCSALIDSLMFLNENCNYQTHIWAIFVSEDDYIQRFPSYLNNPYFHPLVHDIFNPFDAELVPDFMIHAASFTHPRLYAEMPVETMKLNLLGTINALEFAKKNLNCKSLFLSTMEIYGENEAKDIYAEDDYGYINIMTQRACYPVSKRAAETMCCCYAKEYNMNVMTARLGYIYGPTVQLSSSKADVQFLNNALNNEDIVMKSNGEQKRSYCYVLDVVSALVTILCKGVSAETYNIANDMGNVCLKDVAEIYAKLSGVNLKFELPSENEQKGFSIVKNSTLSSKKIEALGWQAKFSFIDGFSHTYQIKKELQNA